MAITHSLDLHTEAKESFLEAMHDILLAPRGLDDYVMQFTGPTGTNAVEAALEDRPQGDRPPQRHLLHQRLPRRVHGRAVGDRQRVSPPRRRRAVAAARCRCRSTATSATDVDTIAYLERMLADPSSGVDTPAAIILETVQGEGGLNVARIEWLQRLQALCHKRKIVLIVDDIQAGCGRTGTFFSFEPAGIKPDIVTCPSRCPATACRFSVVLLKRSLDEWKPAEHNGTFRGNNHAFVTATAMLEHYWRTPAFAEEVQAKGEHLGRRLQAMVDRFSPAPRRRARPRHDARRALCRSQARGAVTAKAFEYGLIIERAGPEDEVIKCMMPLTTRLR